jgi:hypothetical protein
MKELRTQKSPQEVLLPPTATIFRQIDATPLQCPDAKAA